MQRTSFSAVGRLAGVLRSSSSTCAVRAFAGDATAQRQNYDPYEVPAGHQDSDLGNVACNISLNRRRDLSLRQDLYVVENGKRTTLSEVMRGQLVALFGVPDMGGVCTKKHLPNFLKNAAQLKKCGIDKIACAAVAPYDQVAEWAKKAGDSNSQIAIIADEDGGMTRMLGLDLPDTGASGPCSQRYAALVDDGILLKLKVETKLGDMKLSSAESIMDILETLKR